MKRSGFLKRTGFKNRARSPLKRSRLRLRGVSDASLLREQIQSKLRQGVIKRDKVCLLAEYPEAGRCNAVLQCEHLISRSQSSTFADLRNCVLLCSRHHIFWKPQHSQRYWEIIEEMIGAIRWEWLMKMRMEQSSQRSYKKDWKLELLALEQQIKKMK